MNDEQKRFLLLEELTHEELSRLPRGRTLVLLPISPIEEHGPHLPLGVDAFLAKYFSEQLGQEVLKSKPDWFVVMHPTLFAGSDVLRYAGSIEIRQSVIRDLLYDCARSFAKDGFEWIVTIGGHGGPRHMVALEEVSESITWRHRHTKMVCASSRFLFEALQGKLAKDFITYCSNQNILLSEETKLALKTDFHAGMVETSLMQVIRPDLVNKRFETLKPAILSSVYRIRPHSAKTVGEGLGHLGTPHLATKEMGEALSAMILAQMRDPIIKFLEGGSRKPFRSMLYYVPFFRSHFRFVMLVLLGCFMLFGGLLFWMKMTLNLLEKMS